MRKWRAASSGPTADAEIDHPYPWGEWHEQDLVPLLVAPDPGGVAPRAGSFELHVSPLDTPVQHSPITNWNPGTPYPGPPATVHHYVDFDSRRWWGKTGQGRLVWSERTEFSADLPPNIPQDMAQHLDAWQYFMGGYPSINRNRPAAFGDQVPTLNPNALGFALAEG
jgi:hypothetical protein